jgi:hypothetical protein
MAMSAQIKRVPSKAAPQTTSAWPTSGDISFRFATFDDDGKMKVLGEVDAWALQDDDDTSPGAVRWSKFLDEVKSIPDFDFDGLRVYMPQRPGGEVPIATNGGLQTALSRLRTQCTQCTQLVLVTSVDYPDLRKKRGELGGRSRGVKRRASTHSDAQRTSKVQKARSDTASNAAVARADNAAEVKKGAQAEDVHVVQKANGEDAGEEEVTIEEDNNHNQDEAGDDGKLGLQALTEAMQTGRINVMCAHISKGAVRRAIRVLPWLSEKDMMRSEGISFEFFGMNADFKPSPYQIVSATEGFIAEQTALTHVPIVADPAGAGKTFQLIFKILLRMVHLKNVDEVVTGWVRGDTSQHLPRDAAEYKRCPHSRHLLVACWCERRNHKDLFNAYYKPDEGANVIITPRAALKSFYDDFVRVLDGSRFLEEHPQLRIAFEAGGRRKDALANYERFPPLEGDEVLKYCKGSDEQGKANAHARSKPTYQDSKGQTQELAWTYKRYRDKGGWEKLGERDYHRAPKAASWLILCTTKECFQVQVKDKFTQWITMCGWRVTGKEFNKERFAILLLVIKYVLIDEFHVGPAKEHQMKVIKAARETCAETYGSDCFPTIYGASGTPDGGTNVLNPLIFCTAAAGRPSWADANQSEDTNLHVLKDLYSTYGVDGLRTLGEKLNNEFRKVRYDLNRLKGSEIYTTVHRLLFRALPLFVIRRPLNVMWLDGQPIVPMKTKLSIELVWATPSQGGFEEMYIQDGETKLKAEVERQYQEACGLWRQQGAMPSQKPVRKVGTSIQGYTTCLATGSLAHVVRWWRKKYGEKGEFVKDNPDLQDLYKKAHSSRAISIHVEAGMDKNAKWNKLVGVLDKIKVETRSDGRCSKVLLGSRWPMTTSSLKTMLKKKYGEKAFVEYTADTPVAERAKAYNDFVSDGDNDEPWVMLATVATIGVGVNLQRAHHAILYEPCGNAAVVEQFFKRVCRRGQTEKLCRGYLFVNTASNLEKRIAAQLEGMDLLQQHMAEAEYVDLTERDVDAEI